ncbi:MAG TPA: SDR family oxidoreductase [Chloroflexota bacterium]|nr:SDR family oxidoreductase [Chloroflexota bacterium]
MAGRLSGKVALVTGGGSGIGRASAIAFAREGAVVFVADLVGTAAENTVAGISAESGQAYAITMDVGSPDSVAAGFSVVDGRGLVANVVMNCAGLSLTDRGDGPSHTIEQRVWDLTILVNLTGTQLVCKNAISRLLEHNQPGSLVNVASRAALNGIGSHAYAAAKGGVALLSRSIGVTYAPQGIRCNALAPGATETPMIINTWYGDPVRRAKTLANVPMGRVGKPEEIAALAVFLASDESAFMTATLIAIDGGAAAD